MKVRARVKAREHLPEWACCCDRAVKEYYKGNPDFILDLDTVRTQTGLTCNWCDKPVDKPLTIVDDQDGEFVELEMFDLDEGPMEEAQ